MNRKAADPSIKIGVVVSGTWKERAGVLLDALKQLRLSKFIAEGYQGWNPKMPATLKQLGVTPDWVSFHRYPQNIGRYENDARLLQSANRWTTDAASEFTRDFPPYSTIVIVPSPLRAI